MALVPAADKTLAEFDVAAVAVLERVEYETAEEEGQDDLVAKAEPEKGPAGWWWLGRGLW